MIKTFPNDFIDSKPFQQSSRIREVINYALTRCNDAISTQVLRIAAKICDVFTYCRITVDLFYVNHGAALALHELGHAATGVLPGVRPVGLAA
jgi:hypothetical protein